MEQTEPKLRKIKPYASKHFFIGGLDTVFGNQLVERIRNQHLYPENPHQIVGTLALQNTNQSEKIPQGIRKVIDTNKVSFMKEVILDSDVIIYDLNVCPLSEVEFAISTLKMTDTKDQKILICISNVMTWAMTPKKIKGQQDEADQPDPESELEQGQQPQPQQEQKQPQLAQGQQPKQYIKFKDSDFALRRPSPSYQTIKSLETLCLVAGKARPNLKSYVICSGILYGKRQPMWQKYFYQAIHQIPVQLPFYDKGKNKIPSIHVRDLVTFVEKTIDRTPPIPYILAIDHNLRPIQKSIIKSISKGIGTGNIKDVNSLDVEHIPQFLLINIGMKPTEWFQKLLEEQADLEPQQGQQVQKFSFPWQYKEGIQKSIKKLCEQFKTAMSIKQIKIFVQGPPASGKSHYCSKLSTLYKLPHLHIKQVISDVLALKQQDELATQVRDYLAQQKATLLQQAQAKHEQMLQKRKKLPKHQRQPIEPVNENNLKPLLSDQLLCKCYIWRLSQNDCMNRGYVLDGFPRTFQQAKQIFMRLPDPVQGQQQIDEQNVVKIVNDRMVPNKVFIFEATDNYILQYLRDLPEQSLNGTHFTEQDTKRRLKIYRNNNIQHTGKQILKDFFIQNDIPINSIKISEQKQLQKLLISTILPINSNQQQNQSRVDQITKQTEQRILKQQQKQDKKQKIAKDIQTEDYKIKKKNEQNQQKEILQKKSLTLRKYLDVNIVPFLSEGVHQILTKLPQNPVDYLAEFLFKISLKVPKADPYTFQF